MNSVACINISLNQKRLTITNWHPILNSWGLKDLLKDTTAFFTNGGTAGSLGVSVTTLGTWIRILDSLPTFSLVFNNWFPFSTPVFTNP